MLFLSSIKKIRKYIKIALENFSTLFLSVILIFSLEEIKQHHAMHDVD